MAWNALNSYHPLTVHTETIVLSGQGDITEVTRWPSFILHAKLVPYSFKSTSTRAQCFASIFSTKDHLPVGFNVESQNHLISFNTTDEGGSDEYNPSNNEGLHVYAPNGIFVFSDFLAASDIVHDNVVLNISYVHKNDYAGAYDSIDCWRGNRWRTSCGREGTPFLENYGSYPESTESGNESDAETGGASDFPGSVNETVDAETDSPPGSTSDIAGAVTAFETITDHLGGRLTSDVFKTIEAYPIPRKQNQII